MRVKTVIFAALLTTSAAGLCLEAPEQTGTAGPASYDQSRDSLKRAFSALSQLDTGNAVVAYSGETTTVINKRRHELESSHPLYMADEFEANDLVLLRTRISNRDAKRFYVLFSEGASADPYFYFIEANGSNVEWDTIYGTVLVVPGSGNVYAANRFNNTFTKRTKHAYAATGLTEVPQPYYYVGLQTHTLKPITLYASPRAKQAVAHLPAGYDIEVLLTDNQRDQAGRTCYLLKTSFGLTGWAWISAQQYTSHTIEGISFWGD